MINEFINDSENLFLYVLKQHKIFKLPKNKSLSENDKNSWKIKFEEYEEYLKIVLKDSFKLLPYDFKSHELENIIKALQL